MIEQIRVGTTLGSDTSALRTEEGIPATDTKASSLHLRESAWPGGGNGLSLAVPTPATRPPQARTESQLESPSARRGGADFSLGGAGRWGRELGNHPLQPMVGTKGETTEPALGGTAAGNRA